MTQTVRVRTPAQLFAAMPDHRFRNYHEFETTLVAFFNSHALDFPTGYGWRDALRWAMRHGVVVREGDAIVVQEREA